MHTHYIIANVCLFVFLFVRNCVPVIMHAGCIRDRFGSSCISRTAQAQAQHHTGTAQHRCPVPHGHTSRSRWGQFASSPPKQNLLQFVGRHRRCKSSGSRSVAICWRSCHRRALKRLEQRQALPSTNCAPNGTSLKTPTRLRWVTSWMIRPAARLAAPSRANRPSKSNQHTLLIVEFYKTQLWTYVLVHSIRAWNHAHAWHEQF